ncbi:hypothetical protein [Leifsonia sp. Leaf264]|uniref:hypothetical protein n=1 Tax=Leifsonia sp. Leaf264 TaxID=1736314 RepID=UPI0012FABB66|nr:hypothetical protein [Leifsonia sp. Leaf264]
MTDATVKALSLLVDDIYALRCLFAHQSLELTELLKFKTFPRYRRQFAEEQVLRFQEIAAGDAHLAYFGTSTLSLEGAMRRLDLPHSDEVSWRLEDPLRHASEEQFEMRRGAAYEADVLEAHVSTAAPKKVVSGIQELAFWLRKAAAGEAGAAYKQIQEVAKARGLTGFAGQHALEAIGLDSCLTNSQYLTEIATHRTR